MSRNIVRKIMPPLKIVEGDSKNSIIPESNNAGAYYKRGESCRIEGEDDMAIKNYSVAIELNPNYIEAYLDRGFSWENKGESDKAIKDFSRAIELKPDLAQAYLLRGYSWESKGEEGKANKDFSKAIELSPDYAKENYIWQQLDSNDVLYCYNRGRSLENKGGAYKTTDLTIQWITPVNIKQWNTIHPKIGFVFGESRIPNFRVLDVRSFDTIDSLIHEYRSNRVPALVIVRDANEELQFLNLIQPYEELCTLCSVESQLEIRLIRLIARVMHHEDFFLKDKLTGVMNCRFFESQLKDMASQPSVKTPLSVILIDLDNFKRFNDEYGHPAGDRVLQQIGQFLQTLIGMDAYVCRYGGDEFTIALYSDYERVVTLSEYLRKEIENYQFSVSGQNTTITASFGVASAWCPINNRELIGQCETALYSAKAQGRNQVVGFNDMISAAVESGEDPDVLDFETKARVLSERLSGYLTLHTKRITSTLKQQAEHDGLTGLYNRMYFDKRISRELEIAHTKHRPLSLLFLDIDYFGKVNKTYGWPAGDDALRTVAGAIKSCIRTVDWIARYGGEEFCVIMRDSDLESAKDVAERMRRHIKSLTIEVFDGRTFTLTVSIGIGEFTTNDEHVEAFIQRVSDKTREAKQSGRDQVRY